ncbi:zinc-binding alcohol dehydrogenase family protein [Xanthomonas arboricola]|uniref:zinc-binding alcohol dehydrogenase family protein n=1 Tax=Xanthomonas cannabis TaxID=1885674 RepID=UPI0015CB8032|nr:zinc-binding alcohol dehydrogenase family protein [Xanthomonas cannabis]MBB3800668.1 zinc-binding alcohol dehydrogenase family protein [Xanthomonas cannabis]
MKAIAYPQHGLPIDDARALVELDLPLPEPGPRDLRVRIHAISVNPVDTKVRANAPVESPRVLGWDASGVVDAVGSEVSLFRPGDAVYYAGALTRPGTNAEFHLVDERLVGRKPATLDDAAAAALPLTAITAWELLFDRLRIAEGGGQGQALLVVGAAGGVGSILVQLARTLTKLTVIGTASRPQTQDWVYALGAHHVIDHTQPLGEGLQRIGIAQVQHVASLTHTDQHFAQLVEVLAPQGQLALIDDPATLDALPLKRKSLSLHWELMFTRSLFETDDMIAQHHLLNRVADLIDSGLLRTTLGEHYGRITVDNLRRAHAALQSHRTRGKLVLEGF